MWVKDNNVNWGPKPFKVFNCWYDHPEFLEFVKNEWNLIQVVDSVAHILKYKIQSFKDKIEVVEQEGVLIQWI